MDETAETLAALNTLQERMNTFSSQESVQGLLLGLEDEARAREMGDEAVGKLLQTLHTSLELEMKERKEAIQQVVDEARPQPNGQLEAFKEQLQALSGGLEQQLRKLEESIHKEAETRTAGNQMERETREELERSLRSLVTEVATNKAEHDAAVREAHAILEDEHTRLWEAMDTHTHEHHEDLEDDEAEATAGTVIDKTMSTVMETETGGLSDSSRGSWWSDRSKESSVKMTTPKIAAKRSVVGSDLAALRAEVETARSVDAGPKPQIPPAVPFATRQMGQGSGSLRGAVGPPA